MKTHVPVTSVSEHLAERIAIVPLLFAVVLGSSLIEFRAVFFPPHLSRIDFWALSIAYLAAFLSWFGWHEATYRFPYTRRPIARLRAGLEALVAISWAGLLFLASEAATSPAGYLWGFTVVYGIHALVVGVRRKEWQDRQAGYQPLRSTLLHGLVMAMVATAYSLWAQLAPPLPPGAAWVFVCLPLGVLVSYRWRQLLQELPRSVLEEGG